MSPVRSSASSSNRRRSPARKSLVAKSSAAKASASFEEPFVNTSPLISPEEKHRLILAHVEARAPRDPLQRITLWGGVAIACAALVIGWAFTVGRSVASSLHPPASDSGVEALTKKLDAFTETMRQAGASNSVSDASAEEFAASVKAILGTTSTPEARNDLIAPSEARATSSGPGEVAE